MTGVETYLMNFWDNFPFVIAFLGGILAFFSPCSLPLVPAYVSYITGISINELKVENKRKKIVINTIAFILGFTLIFILVYMILLYFANFASKYIYSGILSKIIGVIVIIFGLNLIGIIRFNFMFNEQRLNINIASGNIFASFLIGMIFGFGWQPCIGPILAMVVGLAANQENFISGITMLGLFSIGLGLPFLIFGLLIEKSMTIINGVKKYSHTIEIVSGIVLIGAGIYIFF